MGLGRQIDDLANMQYVAKATVPWLRIRPHSVYAMGGSMGGQETLLLVARFNTLLAGAVAFDSPTDLARRYRDFARLSNGRSLQALARREIGGVPESHPGAYARRSPINFARAIAFSRVPLQMFWSVADEVVLDQAHNSAALFRRIKELNPAAPVTGVAGNWTHSAGMAVNLPDALRLFGLLPPDVKTSTKTMPPFPQRYNDDFRGWPVSPQHQQHPVRGTFLDPRPDPTFGAIYHTGVDVAVRDDRPEQGAPAAGRTASSRSRAASSTRRPRPASAAASASATSATGTSTRASTVATGCARVSSSAGRRRAPGTST